MMNMATTVRKHAYDVANVDDKFGDLKPPVKSIRTIANRSQTTHQISTIAQQQCKLAT